MTQLSLTDAIAGAALKEAGLSRIERSDTQFVTRMRAIAKDISLESGFVSIDNLRPMAEQLGWAPVHPNSWGTVFKGPHWKEVGRQRSAWPSNHHRFITIWEYVP